MVENPAAVELQQNSSQKTQQVKYLKVINVIQKMTSYDDCLTLSSHIFSQREEDTLIYSAVIFAMMKTDGGIKDTEDYCCCEGFRIGLVRQDCWYQLLLFDVAESA